MTVDIDSLATPATADDIFAEMLSMASTLGLDTTAWQPGQPERTVLRIAAQKLADEDIIVAQLAASGFLDLAAKTSVTPEGGPGWLDLLAHYLYQVDRIAAKSAATTEVLTCSGASGGTFAVGAMHFVAGEFVYTNTAAFVLPANGTVAVPIQADVPGAAATAGAGAINALLTPLVGVTCTNPAAAVGTDAETNASLAQRCRDRLAALSVDGPAGAYDYNARTINGPNQVAVASGALTQPVQPVTKTKVVVDPDRGGVTTYVASAVGAYATPPNYVAQLPKAIAGTTDASPIVVNIPLHGYLTGNQIYIADHLANTAANGSWIVTFIDINHFSLDGSTGIAVGGATGTAYRYSDLDLIDRSIQANAVPLAVSAETLSAVDVEVSVVGVITVTGSGAAFTDTQIASKVTTALAELAQALPIGGQGTSGLLFLETIRRTIYDAVPDAINVVLSSPSADVSVVANGVVGFLTPTITVVRS